MLRPQVVVLDLALSLLLGCSGVGGAWLLRRRSSLSIRNLYPLAVLAIAAVVDTYRTHVGQGRSWTSSPWPRK
jgi:hypothetical protein